MLQLTCGFLVRYNCQPGNAAVITRIMSVPTNNCHLSNNHDQCNCDCSNNCKCCNVFQVIRHLKVGKTIAINCTKSKVQAGNYFEILLGNTRDKHRFKTSGTFNKMHGMLLTEQYLGIFRCLFNSKKYIVSLMFPRLKLHLVSRVFPRSNSHFPTFCFLFYCLHIICDGAAQTRKKEKTSTRQNY